MRTAELDIFLAALADSPGGAVFNPWRDIDPDNDADASAPAVRLAQLRQYLALRATPKNLLIAEALGYQGGHFSGIAMTSKRILLWHHRDRGVAPADVLGDLPATRTSNANGGPKGFNEPTATIVWSALAEHKIPPADVILWNAFPWHPYHPDRGHLSNRTPTNTELDAAAPILKQFLALYPNAAPIAIGKKSEALLANLGIHPATALRHPANGGATKFRQQLHTFASR